ncbi:glycosyltransferase family 2 protein [Spirosoma daeguense]
MNNPLISVITVVYNSAATLKATIESVVNQDKNLFEYVVIDGGSKDGSLEIIQSYDSQIDTWISERDKGIFDAMNKGVERSKGKWIYFLGADDTLYPDALAQISQHLASPYKVVFGDVVFSNGHLFRSFLSSRTLMQNTLHHQGTFYHRSLFDDFKYDQVALPIQADYELNLIVYLKGSPGKYVPVRIANYMLGGNSAGPTEKSYNEINLIRSRHLKNPLKNVALTVILRLYYWQKQFRFWLYGHLA